MENSRGKNGDYFGKKLRSPLFYLAENICAEGEKREALLASPPTIPPLSTAQDFDVVARILFALRRARLLEFLIKSELLNPLRIFNLVRSSFRSE